ncbi:DUF4192 domain-containing protein [Streptantibioticus parmotrematis]|uniref:DUF4192 domain-containing protein n=1 Tax=Streptantibioticus parmotrematis TaxID=2873249 RepID=UPI003F4D6C20
MPAEDTDPHAAQGVTDSPSPNSVSPDLVGSSGKSSRRLREATVVPREEPRVTLRGPADLAEALPFLLGFHPDDSVVLVALHGSQGRFGDRLRVGIPAQEGEWPHLAAQLADSAVHSGARRGRPEGIAVFLCQDPRNGEAPNVAMERLRPLAQHLRVACGALDVPVLEALCVSAGRWWSYCCPDEACCPPEGTPISRGGTSVLAAAAAYAGITVRGSLREMTARLAPLDGTRAVAQVRAFDDSYSHLVPRMLRDADCETVRDETLALAGAALERFRAASARGEDATSDAEDDALLGDDEAATIIVGLQDRDTRDRAAEWMEGTEAVPALRLWRALARRCVAPYDGHAAAPLTLAGWVSWATGDQPAARVAFGRALDADPDYTFARLLHQACNRGLDPEPLRRCLREERGKRLERIVVQRRGGGAGTAPKGRPDSATRPAATARSRSRIRTRRSPVPPTGGDPE